MGDIFMVLVIDWLLLYHYSILMHPQAAWNFHAKLGGDVDFYEQYTILIGVSVPMFQGVEANVCLDFGHFCAKCCSCITAPAPQQIRL